MTTATSFPAKMTLVHVRALSTTSPAFPFLLSLLELLTKCLSLQVYYITQHKSMTMYLLSRSFPGILLFLFQLVLLEKNRKDVVKKIVSLRLYFSYQSGEPALRLKIFAFVKNLISKIF